MESFPNLMPASLQDDPHPGDETDGARNSDVIATLSELFIRHQGGTTPTIRVGLFGGLGQGKTSSWIEAKKIAEKRTNITRGWDEEWIHDFDVAKYQEKELEYELDRILQSLKPNNTNIAKDILNFIFKFFLLLISSIVGAWLIISGTLFLFGSQATFDSFLDYQISKGGMLALIFVILSQIVHWVFSLKIKPMWGPSLTYRQRENERRLFLGHKELPTFFNKKPTWLIIDNLDRATEAQQRSVLRALYKQPLPFSVLVCMDESRLLQAPPSPESPVELLTKAIQLQVRMPGRVPLDACRIAWQITSISWPTDHPKKDCWHILLSDLRVVAGLARALTLLNTISPRHAKRLLNDTNLLHWQLSKQRSRGYIIRAFDVSNDQDTQVPEEKKATPEEIENKLRHEQFQIEIQSAEEWLAALRIIMLTQALPALRNDNSQFANALSKNTTSHFREFILTICEENKSVSDGVTKIFAATRHWRPRQGEWLPFVAIAQLDRRSQPRQKNEFNILNIGGNELPTFQVFDHFWRGIGAIGDGYDTELLVNNEYFLTSILENNATEDKCPANVATFHALMLTADMYCFLAADASQSLRATAMLAPWAYKYHPLPGTLIEANHKAIAATLWPTLAARDDIGAVLTNPSVKSWLDACNSADLRLCIASLLPPTLLSSQNRLTITAEPARQKLDDIVSHFSSNGTHPYQNNQDVWAWNNSVSPNKHIARYWPPLNPLAPDIFLNLAQHLDWWRTHLAGKPEMAALPNSLNYLLLEDPLFYTRFHQNKQDQLSLLDAIINLFAVPATPIDKWQLSLIKKWQHNLSSKPLQENHSSLIRLYRFIRSMTEYLQNQHLINPERVLVLHLLAMFLGKVGVKMTARAFPTAPTQQTTLLRTHLSNQTWHHTVGDATWLKIFGNKDRPVLFSESKPQAYLLHLHQTHLVARRSPSLIIASVEYLLRQIEQTKLPLSRRKIYLADLLLLQKRTTVPPELAAKINAVTLPLVTPSFEQCIVKSRFTDIDDFEAWLFEAEQAIPDSLASFDDDQLQPEINRRIEICLALAPDGINEEFLISYKIRLRSSIPNREPQIEASPQIILLRGAPDSKRLACVLETLNNFVCIDADIYFAKPSGYEFTSKQFAAANAFCLEQTKAGLNRQQNLLVANRFTSIREIVPYLGLTESIEVIEASSPNTEAESATTSLEQYEALPPWLARLVRTYEPKTGSA